MNGQTVVVIGGSAGIGLSTARVARAAGADVILTGRNPERLERSRVGLQRLIAANRFVARGVGRHRRRLRAD